MMVPKLLSVHDIDERMEGGKTWLDKKADEEDDVEVEGQEGGSDGDSDKTIAGYWIESRIADIQDD